KFHGELGPALAASWLRRNFELIARTRENHKLELERFVEMSRIRREELLLFRAGAGLSFSQKTWRALVGEILLCFAAEIPEIPTAFDSLDRLLSNDPRLFEVHHGTRPLVFGGGWYRPDNAGYNAADDVARLADYLGRLEPDRLSAADLGPNRAV